MVIREEISSSKSIVFTPTCNVAEGSDGKIIINNDFQQAKSFITSLKLEDWNYDQLIKDKQNQETSSIKFENDENKLQSFVMINDPTLYFYNKTTNKGIHIERQFIVSSFDKPPASDKLIDEYKDFIDLANPLIKI